VVAGHGDQQNRHYKYGAKNHHGFRGEMNQRSTGGHANSPQSIIRTRMDGDFSGDVAWFLQKNWPVGQEG
jgi:hypothetical protein